MGPTRLSECLDIIGWSPPRVANLLGCEESYIHALLGGTEEIPGSLAGWLESLVLCHEAAVPPEFRGRSARIIAH